MADWPILRHKSVELQRLSCP